MKRFLLIALSAGLTACAPRIITQSNHQLPPIAAQETFLIVKSEEGAKLQGEELGDIRIKDSGFTLVCDYETVEALAVSKAKSVGANILWIYEHKLPDIFSTCHQIRAKAMRVADATAYEKEIVWTPTRRLRQADFKASTKNRPFAAAASSNIRYRYEGRLFGPVMVVETYFECFESYFKDTSNAAFTLAHEQLHFDITELYELYARRFAKVVQEEVTNIADFQRRHESIMRQISSDCHIMQDQYDTEVYADPTKLEEWQQRIKKELTALQAYAHKSVQTRRQ